MTTPNRPPLWKAMDRAAYPQPHPPGHNYRAAEIRAIAEWIKRRQVEDYEATLPDVREVIGWLTAEADRAEKGDG